MQQTTTGNRPLLKEGMVVCTPQGTGRIVAVDEETCTITVDYPVLPWYVRLWLWVTSEVPVPRWALLAIAALLLGLWWALG